MNFHSAKKKNAGVAGYVKFSDVADGNSGKLCGTVQYDVLVYHSGKKSTEQTQTFVLYFFSFALCYDQIFIKRTFAINQTFRD